ncbi:hypothetical protein LBMAG42_46630 [Deltaproteobacteria bacterium]|nr:hypothetical protein LBMAG42_46630 [Deltaproteobacteria bacterium]
MFHLLLGACTTESPLGHDLGALTIEVDPALPNVVHVAWTGVPGKSRVAYGLDGVLDRTTSDRPVAAATALALKSGRTYTFRASTTGEDGTEWTSESAEVTIAAPFVGMPTFEVADVDQSAWEGDGFVLLTIFQATGSYLAVVDREGDYVWTMASREGTAIPSAHFTDDGRRIIYIDNDLSGTGWGGVGIVALDGSVNEYRELPYAHHDAIELPDGSIAWLEFEKREITTEEGDVDTFTTDAIYTAPTLDGEPRRVFSIFDDYGHTPWHVCSHSATEVAIFGGEDFTHGNTLMFDAASDNFLYQSKFLDAIVAVDRVSGAAEWQAGGRFGTFTDEDGDTIDPERAYDVDGPHQTWWSHAHMSHAWPEGFVVYDNGTHHSPLVSRIAAYSWDTSAHTLRRTFAFTNETGVYDPILGDVRRLDGGNYLVSWTMSGMLTEVTPDGRVVWRASAELGSAIGRTGYLETFYP